eukprot:9091090-Lingulodinium_polyedra.AAC.1
MVFMSYLMEPLEHLLQWLQALSEGPSPLLKVLTRPNVLEETANAYRLILLQPCDAGHFKEPVAYFTEHKQLDAMRVKIISILAQLWWRFQPYRTWPYKFAALQSINSDAQ